MPTLRIGNITNSVLFFSKGGSGHLLYSRISGLSHGFDVIAAESQARQYRAFYPHKRATSPFTVTFELNGYEELKSVMNYLRQFMTAVIQTGSTSMTVQIPERGFSRQGLPTGGMVEHDQTASNVFRPTVVFDSVTTPGSDHGVTHSTAELGSTTTDDAAQFFYPTSPAVNDPNAKADSFYDSAPMPAPHHDPSQVPNTPPPLPLPGTDTVDPAGPLGWLANGGIGMP